MRNTRLQLLAVFCLWMPSAALTQESANADSEAPAMVDPETPAMTDPDDPEMIDRIWDFGVGIGYGENSNPFIGADDVINYMTLDLAIYGDRFFFDNGELGFTWIDRPGFGLNVLANYSSERIYYSYFNDLALFSASSVLGGPQDTFEIVPANEVVQPEFAFSPPSPTGPPGYSVLRLPDRDFSVNMGLEALWDMPSGQLQWQVLHDVSNTHQGMQMDVGFSHTWVKGNWAFKPNVGVSWKSSQMVDYYYGLNNKSNYFRFQYEGADAINISMGFLLSYRINNNLSYVNQFSYTQLDREIHESPLVETNHTQSYFSGLYYRF